MKNLLVFTTIIATFCQIGVGHAQPAPNNSSVSTSLDIPNIIQQESTVPELTFEKGTGTYTGTLDTKKINMLTIGTKFGEIPLVLFCNSKVKDWGMMPLYLDQVTDNDIRYRRSVAMNDLNNKLPSIYFNSKGTFIKSEGSFPPTDCEDKNIISKE